jgi:hypothetical protein
MDSIKQYIKAREKQDWLIFGLMGAAVVLGVIYCITDEKSSQKLPAQQEKIEISSSTKYADVERHLSSQLHRKIQKQGETFQKQKEELGRESVAVKDAFFKIKEDNQNIREELVKLKTQLQEAKDNTCTRCAAKSRA